MTKSETIKQLFFELSRAEQLSLLRELNSNIETENPASKINEIAQANYGQNISFEVKNIGSDGNPQIQVKLTTPWGEYENTSINQRIAKAQASELALLDITNM